MASTGSNITGNIWDLVLARVETKVNQHIYSTWFKPTSFVGDDGKVLRVRVPNALFSNWLTKHYSVVIDEALAEVHRPGCAVSFVTEESDPDVKATVPASALLFAGLRLRRHRWSSRKPCGALLLRRFHRRALEPVRPCRVPSRC